MAQSTEQVAFDAAVKARCNALYTGIANLEQLRQGGPSLGPWIHQLTTIRQFFNDALAAFERTAEASTAATAAAAGPTTREPALTAATVSLFRTPKG